MKEKASSYLGMAFIPFALLGAELLVLFIESLFYGIMNFSEIIETTGISAPLKKNVRYTYPVLELMLML